MRVWNKVSLRGLTFDSAGAKKKGEVIVVKKSFKGGLRSHRIFLIFYGA